ncbi:28S ribosomal protein S25 mitochondrial [Fasciola hepatica]|uniref:Small ribosomal subunit protein mS25 n=1 Tax=Fasciola hepatica TaxID=6192 RepID=A0A4E0QWL8_FASHE|nr:28S ribosomal protein S25 mitochondrial [Fasciola hepatica]
MPFLKGGRLAITRTRKYLESGRIILQDSVKIITIHHVPGKKISEGCDELIKWFLPPLQFKNPKVQILTLKNMCPTPFIQVFLNNQEELVIDCSYRTHVDINKHLNEVLGTSLHSTVSSTMDILNVNHPGNFGTKYQRQCICEVYGQVPCSSQVGRSGPWPGQEPQLPVVDGLTNQKGQDANEPKDSTA